MTHSLEETKGITPVQILMKKDLTSVKNGYIVGKDSGYTIINGKGFIGSLITKDGLAAGIVTQIGKEDETGFLRTIQWNHLPRIFNHIKSDKTLHLGISAQAQQFKDGIQVVRIAPNSILSELMMMGDLITKVNGQKIRQVQAIQRISILSGGDLTFQVLREDIPVYFKVQLK